MRSLDEVRPESSEKLPKALHLARQVPLGFLPPAQLRIQKAIFWKSNPPIGFRWTQRVTALSEC